MTLVFIIVAIMWYLGIEYVRGRPNVSSGVSQFLSMLSTIGLVIFAICAWMFR